MIHELYFLWAALTLMGLFALRMWWAVRQFHRKVRTGHPVVYYVNEDRYQGTVVRIENNVVTINTGNGITTRNMKDIYPVIGWCY